MKKSLAALAIAGIGSAMAQGMESLGFGSGVPAGLDIGPKERPSLRMMFGDIGFDRSKGSAGRPAGTARPYTGVATKNPQKLDLLYSAGNGWGMFRNRTTGEESMKPIANPQPGSKKRPLARSEKLYYGLITH